MGFVFEARGDGMKPTSYAAEREATYIIVKIGGPYCVNASRSLSSDGSSKYQPSIILNHTQNHKTNSGCCHMGWA